MTDGKRTDGGLSRRGYLRTSGAALAAMTSLAGCSEGSSSGGDGGDGGGDGGSTGSSGSDDDPITVGVVDAQSGNAALTGTPKVLASELAVSEINDDGGILGREVELLTPIPNPTSTPSSSTSAD